MKSEELKEEIFKHTGHSMFDDSIDWLIEAVFARGYMLGASKNDLTYVGKLKHIEEDFNIVKELI